MISDTFFTDLFAIQGLAIEVLRGLLPLLLLGAVFALLPWNRKNSPVEPGFFKHIFKGGVLVFLGLTLFLHGIELGFLPIGKILGAKLAVLYEGKALIIFGFFLGLAVCSAEPAVKVLCHEVEDATSGGIPNKVLFTTILVGVSLATGLGMARLVYGWSLLYLTTPFVIIMVLLSTVCPRFFVGIAYDASTVVTGPMVATFLMAVALSAADSIDGRSAVLHGFGLVAVVAMVPIIAVLTFGTLYQFAQRRKK